MFSRFFGQRNPEKDIERIVVDLHGANICRVIALAVGWKINEGATARFLQHSTGFQLDDYGNARGPGAVDLQQTQTAATQVASGANSFLSAGYRNTASGAGAGVVGGADNVVSGGLSGSLGGDDAIIDGYASIGIGGYGNQAPINYSIAKGSGAKTHSYFQEAHGQKQQNAGDAQVSRFPMSILEDHNDATWRTLDLFSDNGVNIPADTVMTFRALVAGTTQGCTKSFGYEIVGVIENDGGTTTLLGSTVTTLYEDDASFDCRAQANDTDDTLEIQVQDADGSSDSVKWCARVVTAEVTYAA